jgi:hypothetical protein
MTHGACNHEIKRLENELSRLRAANAELVEALDQASSALNTEGTHYEDRIDDAQEIIGKAISRAEQAKPEPEPETCVWTDSIARRSTACGIEYDPLGKHQPDLRFCPFCGRRIEVKR